MKSKRIENVLVTGGLGFIGRHTVNLLLERGYHVKVLDNVKAKVQYPARKNSETKNPSRTIILGDIRKKEDVERALDGVDAVVHLAAAVGVGQSMYEVEKYVDNNTKGTATLLDALINGDAPVRKLVVASSMSVYGEGKYTCENCGPAYPEIREEHQLKENQWEPRCPACAHVLSPAPTDESKILMPSSIYAQSKRHEEEMSLLIGRTYGIPTIALRYFGVYGPGQSLSNPYTGVCAIFATRILNEKPPYVFEDGKQLRDFVNVADVAHANLLALESNASGKALNIGNGKPMSIEDIAWTMSKLLESRSKPYFSRQYRKGDVRHCFADITAARNVLGYEPKVTFENGLRSFADWVKNHAEDAKDRSEIALGELRERQLVV